VPAAVAEGLVAKVGKTEVALYPGPADGVHEADRTAHVELGLGSDRADELGYGERRTLVAHVQLEALGVQPGQVVQVGHVGAAAAGVHEPVVRTHGSQHPGHAGDGGDPDAAGEQNVRRRADPKREAQQRLGDLEPVAEGLEGSRDLG
jgi:hypothetical protein